MSTQRSAPASASRLPLIVPRSQHGRRIDHALAGLLRTFSPFRFQRAAAAGDIVHNGRLATPNTRVFAGDELVLSLRERPDDLALPSPRTVSVDFAYRDHWLGVVDKPPGVVVHPTGPHQHDTLLDRLTNCLPPATRGLIRPGLVHRLDQETSGLIAVAFESDTHAGLQQQFECGLANKTYLAVVNGRLPAVSGTIDRPIGRLPGPSGVLMTTGPGAIRPRAARTAYRVLANSSDASLVRVLLHTGRNHQIRVHFASIGHPVCGDRFYRADRSATTSEPRLNGDAATRQMLHAERLRLSHPITDCPIDIARRPPRDMLDFIAACRMTPRSHSQSIE